MIVKIENLKKYFPVRRGFLHRTVGWIQAVDGVSLEIKKGSTLGLVGESGCGKTTLGRAILRLIEPDSGEIYYEQENVTRLKGQAIRRLRQNMQIVFQDPDSSLNPRFTVSRIVGEGMHIFKLAPKDEIKQRVKELIDMVGLPLDSLNRYPHQFSGGQRQRIGIARALSMKPSFIVLDEPVSSLDVSVQAQIINLLYELQEKICLSYLFITHDLNVTRQVANDVAVMYMGKVVEVSQTEELFNKPAHPYTRLLLEAMPISDPAKRKERPDVKGEVGSAFNLPTGCRFRNRCPLAINICSLREPQLKEISPGHLVACHHY
ncbi:MAG: ABC transporter ATP-binding protein [Candidatus Omnitrophica bacterium]|nr:ABC transporter ATP-binding protein [Candidatus Omnitrophota bacterium]